MLFSKVKIVVLVVFVLFLLPVNVYMYTCMQVQFGRIQIRQSGWLILCFHSNSLSPIVVLIVSLKEGGEKGFRIDRYCLQNRMECVFLWYNHADWWILKVPLIVNQL